MLVQPNDSLQLQYKHLVIISTESLLVDPEGFYTFHMLILSETYVFLTRSKCSRL